MSNPSSSDSAQHTFVVNLPKKTSPRFSFVTISNPDEIRDSARKTVVRKHVKKRVDLAKEEFRKSQNKQSVFEHSGTEQPSRGQEEKQTSASSILPR